MSLAIDLGRHRTYGARTSLLGLASNESEGAELLRLTDSDPALLIRVNQPGLPRRFTEALIYTAGYEDEVAAAITADAAAKLTQAFAEAASVEELSSRILISVPVALGPTGRAILLRGLAAEGLMVDPGDVIERPIAALAEWLSDREKIGGDAPSEPVAVIDNDGGEISVLVADTGTKRLLAIAPISQGPDDETEVVLDRLKAVLSRGAAMLEPSGTLRQDDWTAVSAAYGHIVLSGSGAEHPRFQNLVTGLLPATPIAARSTVKASQAVIAGLTELHQINEWACSWPTGHIMVDGKSVRPPGPLNDTHEELVVQSTSRSHVSIADARGDRSNIQVSSVIATGVWIPQALGSTPKMRLLDDGRILLLGAPGVRPLSFIVNWPVPGRTQAGTVQRPISVAPLGRRALGLVSPRVDRARQAKAE